MTTDSASPQSPHRNGRHLSDMLEEVLANASGRISVANLLTVFGERAFGALILVFAGLAALPIPIPGITALLGAPLVFLAGQLMLGHPHPWLPAVIADRSLATADFRKAVDRMRPYLLRAETFLKPRYLALTGPQAERLLGAVILVLAVIIFLPIPLGNMLPAIAVSVLALGLLERDGLAILIGLAIGIVSLVIVSGVIYGILLAIGFLLGQLFGV
ncbi:exopolysaccharide biosynthesis protein [Oceanibaculum pacificum]|uniref:Exopolysaccharide biosynthesis protein n=1 Tax=Oceanibaculum pacificum TaxID=580166 RepID=A0A154V8J5_9PROT|nr:exopolysaccharide biosynthesis protein [Oceanibaculum pacificum]KZC97666.1 hypothetical protein AUP43_15030 [Oceanibaculum pacificum]